MSIKCDVLVIGGGPAGLSAELFLSKKGLSTIVIEKGKTPGPIQTQYNITEGFRIKEIIDEIGIKPNKISSVSEWVSPDHSYILDSKIQDFYFKRGSAEDSIENTLLRKLKNKVDNIFFESTVQSIELKEKVINSIIVNVKNEKIDIKPRYVVIADGPQSEFRTRLEIKPRVFAKFKGFGFLVQSKENNIIPHAKIYFDEKIAPGGYVYSGSVGREAFFCLVIDDIFSEKISLKDNLDYFLKKIDSQNFSKINNFGGIGISGIQEAQVGNILFIGVAALFNDPFLGYGLNYAIESAYFASNAIGKDNMKIYTKYVKEIQKGFKDLFFAREIWRKADNAFFDRLIKAFNGDYDMNDENINKILELFDED